VLSRSRSAPLVGRDTQLTTLHELVADVVAGRGRAVWIEGEPGIGKSTLLDAALTGVEQRGCQLFRGAAHELSQRFPLRVLLECLHVSEASPDPARSQIAALLRTAGSEVSSGDPVIPASESLLAFVDGLCASSPVVLVVDDLQWADEASLAVWDRLLRSVGQLPLLLIAASRPVGRQHALAGLRRAFRSEETVMLPLKPLTSAQAAQVVSGLLGARPGPGLRQLAERAGGNPLYLREIVDSLVRDDQAKISDDVAEVGTPDLGAPVSLSAAIADRLDFLSRGTRDALQIAALLGPEFAVTDVAVVTGHTVTHLIPIVEEGIASGVLTESGSRLAFRHNLIRDALAAGIPAGLRSALHLHAAQALVSTRASTDRVAEQLLAATDSGAIADEWVLDWLVEAGPQLVYRAPGTAADLLGHTADRISSGDPRGDGLTSLLITAAWLDGRDAEVEQRARQVLSSDPAPALRAQVTWNLAYVLGRSGRIDEAIAVVLEALADRRIGDVWSARLRALHAMGLNTSGRTEEGDTVAQAALAEAEHAGDLLATGYALHALSNLRLRNPNKSGALAYLDRAVNLVPEHPDTMDLRLLLLLNYASALEDVDRLDDALTTSREAVRLAERFGSRMRRAGMRTTLGEQLYAAGQWDDAIAELETVDAPYPYFRQLSDGLIALIAAHRDDRASVDRLLATFTGAEFASGDYRLFALFVVQARSLVAELDGDLRRATELLASMLEPGWESDSYARWVWLPDLVRLATTTGDTAIAQAALAAAEADAAAATTVGRIACAERCRGLVEQDPEPLLSAVDRYRAIGRPLELAGALEDAAVHRAGRGDGHAARAALDEALTGYAELGAHFNIRRATARLRTYGLRRGQRGPRRRPTTGWEALTPTELQVAEQVAKGRSNPEIATTMFLSRRTVQTHISHILAKLGARSRVEIAQEASRRLPDTATADARDEGRAGGA
jgi:DNA-binding CsgD family transcriptional regulator/tetratricopeptide (TPR) repeat protein